jgi:hypothetical protein
MTLRCGDGACRGSVARLVPIKTSLTTPGAKRLKLKYDKLLSSLAFKFNLRHYTVGVQQPVPAAARQGGGCMAVTICS